MILAMSRWIPLASLLALIACDSPGGQGDETAGGSTQSAAVAAPSASAGTASTGSVAPTGSATAEPTKADPSRFKLKGKAIQGGLVFAQVDPGTHKLKFPGHRAVISAGGKFLIAFYRNAPKQEKITITFPDGAVLDHTFEVEQRSYEEDRIDNLPEHFVTPPPETRKQLAVANKRIAAVRKRYTKTAHYDDGFAWPCVGKITSRYGMKRIFNGRDTKEIHWGVDIAAPVGTPVKAPAGGTVVFAEAKVPLAGNTIILDHGHGLTSTFLHLNRFARKVGDPVAQGDVIATVGVTGRTNGAHLDWRMNFFETRIDPELLVPPMASK
jgi:murein DD-endopeptidase MepM/ murein hydrolase activator NlpD